MKCQSKINVNWVDTQVLIKGEWYECEPAPIIYDVITFKPDEPSYIVKCEDGMLRKYNADNFLTISEVREIKLKELGI
jgi:hypothetical protein